LQNQCAGLEEFFESAGFLSIFFDISCGFTILFNDPFAVLFVVLAAFVGIIFGALPGLTAAAAIAMMLPILIAYNDEIGGLAGLAFLYVIGKSGRYGGSIAAILFNTPGTAASAATMQDGYPMTQNGQAGKALKTATVASAYGDYFGEIVLIFGAVAIAGFTRQFGPPENFAIYLMAFVVIGSVVSDSIIKGIISTLFGAVVGLIGEDIITGQFKMTMGIDELESGMALVPLLIGVFVISDYPGRESGQSQNDETGFGQNGGPDSSVFHLARIQALCAIDVSLVHIRLTNWHDAGFRLFSGLFCSLW